MRKFENGIHYTDEVESLDRLCLYRPNGAYYGYQVRHSPEAPDEIMLSQVRGMAETHSRHGLEVRITNLEQDVVFQAQQGRVIWPDNQEQVEAFWEKIESMGHKKGMAI